MLKNPYVRILIVVLLAVLLYYLVVVLARGVAAAPPVPTLPGLERPGPGPGRQ